MPCRPRCMRNVVPGSNIVWVLGPGSRDCIFGNSFTFNPASLNMKGGIKWCSIEGIYNALYMIKTYCSSVLLSSYTIAASTNGTCFRLPTSLAKAFTFTLKPVRRIIVQAFPSTTMFAWESSSARDLSAPSLTWSTLEANAKASEIVACVLGLRSTSKFRVRSLSLT